MFKESWLMASMTLSICRKRRSSTQFICSVSALLNSCKMRPSVDFS